MTALALQRKTADLAPSALAGAFAITVSVAAVLIIGPESYFLLAAIVAVTGIALWCATTSHPKRALIVVGLYLALADGYIKLKINSTSATLLRDILLYAVVLNFLLHARERKAEERGLPPMTVLAVGFAGAVLIQVFNPEMGSGLQALAGLRQHLEFIPLFFIGALYVRSKEDLYALLRLLVFVGTINSAVNLVQFNMTPEQLASWGPGYADKILGSTGRIGFTADSQSQFVRAFGLGSDIGFGGTMAALALPACLALALRARTTWIVVGLGLVAIVNVVGVITGGARVSMILGVVGLTVFMTLATLSRRALRIIGLTALLTAVATAALPILFQGSKAGSFDRLQTLAPARLFDSVTNSRGATLDVIPTYLGRYPFGAGIGRTGAAASLVRNVEPLNAESQVTFLVVETGLVGLILLLVLSVRINLAVLTRSRLIRDPERRAAVVALGAPLIGLTAIWLGAPVTANTPSAPYFWLATGVVGAQLFGTSIEQNNDRAITTPQIV